MRKTVVIPTYWGRKKEIGWQPGDIVYDHPTPIDEPGTLLRTLESMKILSQRDFKLVILICPTTESIEKEAEEKVKQIIEKADLHIETYIFTNQDLKKIKEICERKGMQKEITKLLSLNGYANVRNMCLYTAHVLSADVVILIDDDEIFENPNFISMATEFIGKRIYGESIFGVAGYYLNKHDAYYDDVNIEPWMTYWDRFGSKAKAFDKIIGCEPRLKHTPFAFGGAMVIHKNLYQIVPFDPHITRGEDIDYVINSKMFGFNFYLDNRLSIKHLPPPKNHPVWQRFREDIYRFLYEREKIRSQYEVSNMHRVSAEDFDPYPGEFLKDDLEDKIFKTNVLLALEYLADGDIDACKESLKNIFISKYEAIPKKDPFSQYRKIQKDWEKLMDFTIQNRYEIRKVMEQHNLSKTEIQVDEQHTRILTLPEIKEIIKKTSGFEAFHDSEIEKIANISQIKTYMEDEIIFREGGKDSTFFIILKGCVRIFKWNEKNEEIILANLQKGEVMGETAIVNEIYFANAKAAEFT
ncbi:MAG TPA: cyclic nucleotide-binding domain-containing protein, partial [Clostridiales bacterium]|nr:cyclic nucleotide-binding domain-containing protein [Clostridiales bacterium]